MHDSHQYPIQNFSTLSTAKKIGSYLVDAGLLTLDQINVALNDQQATGMRFGEIIVARGWLKEQTIEWIMLKVVEPERQALKRQAIKRQEASRPKLEPIQPASGLAHYRTLQSTQPTAQAASKSAGSEPLKPAASETPAKPAKFIRREVPISKPLPPINSVDSDVNWVG
jgi:hypothetical protein